MLEEAWVRNFSCDVMVIRKNRRGQARRKTRPCFEGMGVCGNVRIAGRLGELGSEIKKTLQLIKMFMF